MFENDVSNIDGLFTNNKQLYEVWLPNIEDTSNSITFKECNNLTKVNNSESLTIDEDSFYNCQSLQEIVINSSTILDYAFYACVSLSDVIISKKLKRISTKAFAKCFSLYSINYEGTIEEWYNIDIAEDWREDSELITIHCTNGDIDLNATYSVYYVSYNDDNKTDMIALFKTLFGYELLDAKNNVENVGRILENVNISYEEVLNISRRINEYGESYIVKL